MDWYRKWLWARNAHCVVLSAANLVSVVIYYVILAVVVVYAIITPSRHGGLGSSFHSQFLLDHAAQIPDLVLYIPVLLILCSVVVALHPSYRPSFRLSEFSQSEDTDGSVAGMTLGRGAGESPASVAERMWTFLWTSLFFSPGQRLLRAIGLLGNLQWYRFEIAAVLEQLVFELQHAQERRGWLPVQDYPCVLPMLEEFMAREMIHTRAGTDNTLEFRLDRKLHARAGLPEPVAAPRPRLSR